jgi:hypothetical protein
MADEANTSRTRKRTLPKNIGFVELLGGWVALFKSVTTSALPGTLIFQVELAAQTAGKPMLTAPPICTSVP